MKKTVYEIVTEQILKLMAQGVAPWRRPWKPGEEAINWFTEKPYRGINKLLTEPGGEYATWKQIHDAGGTVKPEERKNYNIIVFYTDYIKEVDEDTIEKFPVLRYYKVYNVNTQCTGLTSKRPITEKPNDTQHNPILEAERIINDFANAPEIVFKSGRAVYNSFFDRVSVPPLNDFDSPEEYYATLFHELVHSTGHKNRLNRKFGRKFADEQYSKEELIAEFGAAMLCGIAGIEQPVIENSAAYIDSWMKVLKNDSRLIVTAANAAQKAADYIQNIKPNKDQIAV
ncbi:ArdC family protein [Paenibacillus campinasensis]|uniref:DUF1738 domain-containing protein n=1 Tax=Paenibacillus campinasensis TaxID=66347 RepID=A0A268EI73_9BACL|nr:zincin-like metallopeptidase domain-containing protein [Paenibacillus campinasensis]PAD72827.1 hypothetical protein CHH67_21195 [Paenibacillus campinasensis]